MGLMCILKVFLHLVLDLLMHAPMTHVAWFPHPIIIMVSYSACTTHNVTILHMVYHTVHLLWGMCVMIDHKERVGLAQNLVIHWYTYTQGRQILLWHTAQVTAANHGRGVQSLWRAHRLHSPSRYCLRSAFSFRFSSSSVCFSLSRASLSSSTWSEQFHGSIYHTLPSS